MLAQTPGLQAVFVAGWLAWAIESRSNEFMSSLDLGLYWAVVTSSTVGYGDLEPTSVLGRALSGTFMMVAVRPYSDTFHRSAVGRGLRTESERLKVTLSVTQVVAMSTFTSIISSTLTAQKVSFTLIDGVLRFRFSHPHRAAWDTFKRPLCGCVPC